MASEKAQTATWNRDDRDLLIELRTNQNSTISRLTSMEAMIKEINSGISVRLLNIESNAVSKIEIGQFDTRIRDLQAIGIRWLGKGEVIAGIIGIVAGLIGSLI